MVVRATLRPELEFVPTHQFCHRRNDFLADMPPSNKKAPTLLQGYREPPKLLVKHMVIEGELKMTTMWYKEYKQVHKIRYINPVCLEMSEYAYTCNHRCKTDMLRIWTSINTNKGIPMTHAAVDANAVHAIITFTSDNFARLHPRKRI